MMRQHSQRRGKIFILHENAIRYIKPEQRKIPDRLDTGAHQNIRDLLRLLHRGRDNTDQDPVFRTVPFEFFKGQDLYAADRGPDKCG